MGTITKGILGGFSGKVGSVVGGNWKGIDYMRSRSSSRRNNPTQAQLEQQARFALAMRFLQSMSGLLNMSFRNFAIKMTGINNALAYTLRNAMTGTYPTFTISFANTLVSRGDLPNVLGPTVTSAAGSIITYNWADNSGTGSAKATDKAILVAYDPASNQAIYTTGSAARAALTDNLNLVTFSGKQVETYIGFISEDGRTIANSIYTGQVTVS